MPGFVRACGAIGERGAFESRKCWCRGVFCGRGGYQRTREWHRDTKTTGPLVSRSEAEYFLRQLDLFTGDAIRRKWIARFDEGKLNATVAD